MSVVCVVQYNCLAASLARDFPAVPEAQLAWANRVLLLAREIRRLATGERCVVCLQEVDVDKVAELVLRVDPDGRYYHTFLKKGGGAGRDGLVVMYTRNLVLKRPAQPIRFSHAGVLQSQCALCLHFADFSLVVTHLKAKREFASVREAQMRQLLDAIDAMRLGVFPTLLVGDLNDTPDSVTLELARAAGFESAHCTQPPPYTTWKIRPHGEERRVEDYILVRHVRVAWCEAVPEALGAQRLPSADYGSDHMALCAHVCVG